MDAIRQTTAAVPELWRPEQAGHSAAKATPAQKAAHRALELRLTALERKVASYGQPGLLERAIERAWRRPPPAVPAVAAVAAPGPAAAVRPGQRPTAAAGAQAAASAAPALDLAPLAAPPLASSLERLDGLQPHEQHQLAVATLGACFAFYLAARVGCGATLATAASVAAFYGATARTDSRAVQAYGRGIGCGVGSLLAYKATSALFRQLAPVLLAASLGYAMTPAGAAHLRRAVPSVAYGPTMNAATTGAMFVPFFFQWPTLLTSALSGGAVQTVAAVMPTERDEAAMVADRQRHLGGRQLTESLRSHIAAEPAAPARRIAGEPRAERRLREEHERLAHVSTILTRLLGQVAEQRTQYVASNGALGRELAILRARPAMRAHHRLAVGVGLGVAVGTLSVVCGSLLGLGTSLWTLSLGLLATFAWVALYMKHVDAKKTHADQVERTRCEAKVRVNDEMLARLERERQRFEDWLLEARELTEAWPPSRPAAAAQ